LVPQEDQLEKECLLQRELLHLLLHLLLRHHRTEYKSILALVAR
jgi:hypothetical protein